MYIYICQDPKDISLMRSSSLEKTRAVLLKAPVDLQHQCRTRFGGQENTRSLPKSRRGATGCLGFGYPDPPGWFHGKRSSEDGGKHGQSQQIHYS